MKQWKHLFFPLVILALLFLASSADVRAESDSSEYDSQDKKAVSVDTLVEVNPLYADVFSESDLESSLASIPRTASETDDAEETSFSSSTDAAAWLRRVLVSRSATASFSYITEDSNYYNVVRSLFSQALEETGSPEEGDYLRYQYGGYACSINYSVNDSSYHYNLTYTIRYYTTSEQEQQVTDEVSRILSELNLDGKTAYEKTEAVYRYLVSSVSYDYEHLDDTEYTLKYSAYAALIEKTAICQGYAAALYRLMMEAGIPCRIIGGVAGSVNHAWNIVQQRGYWYNVDSTWDSEELNSFGSYSWFLLSDSNFFSHTRDEQYRTDDFYRSYPMGTHNFNPNLPEEYDLSSKEVTLSACSLPYTGSELKPAVTISGLTEGTDFQVTYENNIHAGTASVIINGIGNCTGSSVRTSFTITRARNTWDVSPSCSDITCSSTPEPEAAARFGKVSFLYSTRQTGGWNPDVPALPGTCYVKADVTGTDDYTGLSTIASFRILLAQPAVSLSNSASGITVKWTKVRGASGYYIYRKTSAGWKKIKTVKTASSLSWTETGLKNGTMYLYSVRAYCGSIKSSGFPYRSIYRISRPSISSLKNSGGQKMVIKWNRNRAATGYQIRYSTDSSFKNAETITISKNTVSARLIQKTISSLSKGKRYYVQIRSCKTAKGTRSYSAWSPVKKITIK